MEVASKRNLITQHATQIGVHVISVDSRLMKKSFEELENDETKERKINVLQTLLRSEILVYYPQ